MSDGTAKVPNGDDGISYYYLKNSTIVGNVVSANGTSGSGGGIGLTDSDTVLIQGNYIGVNVFTESLGNEGHGLSISSVNYKCRRSRSEERAPETGTSFRPTLAAASPHSRSSTARSTA